MSWPPGVDAFTADWVKRGEELQRIRQTRPLTEVELDELEVLKARAVGLQREPESEVAAAFLKREQQLEAERVARDAAQMAIGGVVSLLKP